MANERRIVELVLKATGDEELKRIARDMTTLTATADKTQRQLSSLSTTFKGVSASAAGLWVGNKIQEGFQLLISTVGDAITEMNELAKSGEAAGSTLNKAAIGGAVEFSKATAELSAQADKLVQDFVGGLAPAMTLIVKQMTGVVSQMHSMFDAGKAVGAMIADQVAQYNKAIATLGAYAKAVSLGAESLNAAYLAGQALLQGDTALAKMWLVTSQAAARAATIYATAAQNIGKAAYNATMATYNAEVAKASAWKPGAGAGSGTGGSGGGSGGKSTRAAATTEEATANDLYAKTMEMVNVQLVEASNNFQKADEERQKWVEGLDRASNDNWESDAKARQDALEKTREQWGFLADAVGEASSDIISGTMSVGQAFKKMAASIIADMIRIQLQRLADKVFGKLFGDAWDPFTNAKGNAFAAGGIVSSPTAFATRGSGIGIMGEAGPEAILPLQRNAAGQLGVTSGASNVTVNNYTAAQVNTRQTDQGIQIDIIERQLADRVRRGGTQLPQALENTYRTGRFANAY